MYGPAPHASRTLRAPAGPAAPVLDPRVPAGPGQGKRGQGGALPVMAPRRLGVEVAGSGSARGGRIDRARARRGPALRDELLGGGWPCLSPALLSVAPVEGDGVLRVFRGEDVFGARWSGWWVASG